MAKRQRDYRAEYLARVERARERGFQGYYQERRAKETGVYDTLRALISDAESKAEQRFYGGFEGTDYSGGPDLPSYSEEGSGGFFDWYDDLTDKQQDAADYLIELGYSEEEVWSAFYDTDDFWDTFREMYGGGE